jgi:hypothetical protein
MGHEAQIELWSPNLTTFCFVGFGIDRPRSQAAEAEARSISTQLGGLESKKISGHGELFFLDLPLYRTYRELQREAFCATMHAPEVQFGAIYLRGSSDHLMTVLFAVLGVTLFILAEDWYNPAMCVITLRQNNC